MIAEIVRRTLEAGKPATTKDANVIDTPEGMTRPPDPHPDIDVVQQALPLPHHPHPPPQSTNDPSIESTPKSQSTEEILLRLLATTIVEPANTLANPKKNALIRAGTEALAMIARMNTPKGNRLVPKRKNANGKNEKRKSKKRNNPRNTNRLSANMANMELSLKLICLLKIKSSGLGWLKKECSIPKQFRKLK